ncbi:MAG: O-antigen ligase family protein [Planctomycetes bacterium]|nr:O-antigen ligase family protein [Planctomycetota bacterium]
MIMDQGERPTFSGTVLQKLLLTLVPLGLLLYGLLRGTDADVHLQIGVAAAFLVYIVTFIDLTLGLAILIACVGLSPELSVAGIQNIRLEDFVVPALILSWITRMMQKRIPMAPLIVTPALPLYGAAIILSTLVGVVSGTTSLSTAILYMGKFTEFFLIYVLFVNNITRREEFRALAVFAVMVALASALMVSSAFADEGGARLSGPLGETANMYGGYLILNLAIALGLFLHSPAASGRFASAAAVVLLAIPVLYTYSRTSFVAIVAAATLFGCFKDRRLLLVALVAGLLTPVIAPAAILDRLTTISGVATGDEPSSWKSRMDAWEHFGGLTLSNSPLLGSGLASVKLGMVDNEYVRVFVDTGAIGLALFLWVLGRLGFRATTLLNRLRPQTFERGFASGYWIAFVAMMIHALGATSYTSIRTMECFIVLTGLFGALHNRCEEWGLTRETTAGGGTILIESAAVLEPQK